MKLLASVLLAAGLLRSLAQASVTYSLSADGSELFSVTTDSYITGSYTATRTFDATGATDPGSIVLDPSYRVSPWTFSEPTTNIQCGAGDSLVCWSISFNQDSITENAVEYNVLDWDGVTPVHLVSSTMDLQKPGIYLVGPGEQLSVTQNSDPIAPEPATWGLVVPGVLLGMAAFARKRRVAC